MKILRFLFPSLLSIYSMQFIFGPSISSVFSPSVGSLPAERLVSRGKLVEKREMGGGREGAELCRALV